MSSVKWTDSFLIPVSIVHIRKQELSRHLSSSLSTELQSLNDFWKLLVQWYPSTFSVLWWSRSNLFYHCLCHCTTVTSSLMYHLKMKRKTDEGECPGYLHESTATNQDFLFFLNPKRKQELIRKELSGYLPVIKKPRKQAPAGFFVFL